MTVHLEQLADEAIRLRAVCVERDLERHGGRGVSQQIQDRRRTLIAATWNGLNPALADLANNRIKAMDRLREALITPDPSCTVTVGRVTLEAVQDVHPVPWRYQVTRGRETVGLAHLTAVGRYVAAIGSDCTFSAGSLRTALEAVADELARRPLTEVGAS